MYKVLFVAYDVYMISWSKDEVRISTREIWWVTLGICIIVLVANGAYRGWL
jgi:hypothetical protein